MNVLRLGNERRRFKVIRVEVHGCVCVLMYATGPGQYPAPAVGNKLWLLMNVPSKLRSYRAPRPIYSSGLALYLANTPAAPII